jgi:hypothetical protein
LTRNATAPLRSASARNASNTEFRDRRRPLGLDRQPPEKLQPAHLEHHHVEQDDVGVQASGQRPLRRRTPFHALFAADRVDANVAVITDGRRRRRL